MNETGGICKETVLAYVRILMKIMKTLVKVPLLQPGSKQAPTFIINPHKAMRMRGAIPPLFHTSSWRGTWLRMGTNLSFYITQHGTTFHVKSIYICPTALYFLNKAKYSDNKTKSYLFI
jgi:hypothetical protein